MGSSKEKSNYFIKSGQLFRSGYFKKGKRNGEFRVYYSNGNLFKEYFVNDLKQRISAFYSDGTLIYKGNYKNDTPAESLVLL